MTCEKWEKKLGDVIQTIEEGTWKLLNYVLL